MIECPARYLWDGDDLNARGWFLAEVKKDVVSVSVELGHDLAVLELNLNSGDARQLIGELNGGSVMGDGGEGEGEDG